jgi:VirB8 protein
LSEMVMSQSPEVERRLKWLPVAWLATWGLAVMSAAVPYWWVIGLLAVGLWELTWQMSGRNKAPVLSLDRVNRRAIQWATFAAIALFALFWVCVTYRRLPVYGEVPAGKVLWSVLISPITEELFFRGLMYQGFLDAGRNLRWKRAFEMFVVLCVASIVQQSPRTYEVTWTEVTRDLVGQFVASHRYRAFVSVTTQEVTDAKQALINPLGLYVTNLTWGEVVSTSGPSSAVDSEQTTNGGSGK